LWSGDAWFGWVGEVALQVEVSELVDGADLA
jgi:hypothetical protein